MKNFILRSAVKNDIPVILSLIKELAIFEKEPDAVVISEKDIYNQAFSENPLIQIVVAEIDQIVVGMALYYYGFSTWKGRSLHLEDLIVKEEFRGNGIGKSLMNHIISIAKSENVGRMSWEVLDWNEPAIKMYQNLGTHFYKDWWLCRLFRNDLEKL